MSTEPTTERDKTLKELLVRIQKLERAVFGNKTSQSIVTGGRTFKGATGGLRLLISKGFFAQRRNFGGIKEAMAKHGYHYSDQAVQTPLNNLSKASGPLVGFKIMGKKVYAKRK